MSEKENKTEEQKKFTVGKEIIKVYILSGSENAQSTAFKKPDGQIVGYTYDVWNKVKETLGDRYEFIETFSDPSEQNYGKFVNDTEAGVHDIVIGIFTHSPGRAKQVIMSHPVMVDGNVIVHKKAEDEVNRIFFIVQETIKLLGILFLFTLLGSVVLYFVEPTRTHDLPQYKKFKNKGLYSFLRSLLTVAAASLGEMGFLAENSSLSLPGIVVVMIIMMIAFLLISFIQSEITAINIQQRAMSVYNKEKVKGARFIGYKGWASTDKFKLLGPKIDEVGDMTMDQIIKLYKDNSEDYEGVVLVYSDAAKYPEIQNDISGSHQGLNKFLASWIINREKKYFADDVNKRLIEIQDSGELQDICRKYFKEDFACSLN